MIYSTRSLNRSPVVVLKSDLFSKLIDLNIEASVVNADVR